MNNVVSKGVSNKYIHFEELESTGKTRIYRCMNTRSRTPIGEIKWYGAWRQYCFFPITCAQTVFNTECLSTISEFLSRCNEEHRRNKAKA